MPYLFDQESGEPFEVSQEQYDEYQRFIAALRPKINPKIKRVVVIGTFAGGGMGSESFKQLWDKSADSQTGKFFIPNWDKEEQ